MLRCLLFLLFLGFLGGPVAAQAPRPNIIFILTDDLGPGDLGVLFQNSRTGEQKFSTPKLDIFAAEGMRLNRHYCPAPVCAPSRASLLLGVHQGHSNVRDNQFDFELANNHTLGSVMREAGYATAAIGKWGLQGGSGFPGHPQNRGFDSYFGVIEHGDAHRHYLTEEGQNVYEGFTDVGTKLHKCYSTDLWTARAKHWITSQHNTSPAQPFFLYLAYTAPHARLDVPTQAYPVAGHRQRQCHPHHQHRHRHGEFMDSPGLCQCHLRRQRVAGLRETTRHHDPPP
jgi:arylsulfatase A-like enzyme